MADRAPQTQDKIIARVPDGLRDRIKAAAAENNRSMNAEIVSTLLEKYPPPADPDLEALIERAMKIAPEELTKALEGIFDRMLASGEISEQDIDDGLVPGVSLRRSHSDD